MIYTVFYDKRVFKDLDALSNPDARRVQERFQELAHNPLPSGVQKLAGGTGLYRIRQGNYRILYTFDPAKKEVRVYAVGHRRDIYRGL